MFELWIKLQLWIDYLIPIFIIGGIVLYFIAVAFIDCFTQNRKITWLKNNGFERYLIGVPSYGNGAFYGWEKGTKRIDERILSRIKYKDLIKRMEDN